MFSFESLIFLLSTIAILTLNYFRIGNNVFQQITAFLLGLTLIFLTRFIFPRLELLRGRKLRLLLLFLSSSLVQFLVISTGGFYSPFLILLHLYTLGTSFLLNSRSPIGFLILAVIALGVNIFINPQAMSLFQTDPGPVILYTISFIAIIPLANLLIYSYHLKDTLFHTLKEYARIGEKREGSILTGLSEMVIVTDKDFNIISASEAVTKTLKLPTEEIISRNIFNILPLKDVTGTSVSSQNVSAQQITAGVAQIINNLSFQSKTDNWQRKVSLQIRPIADSQGAVNQIVFIIADASAEVERHTDLSAARQKYQLLFKDLQQTLLAANLKEPAVKLEVLEKIEEDLQLAAELEDHPVEQRFNFYDIAYIARQVSENKQKLANSLGITLQFELSPKYLSERAMLDLIKTNLPEKQLPLSEFAVATNKKWAEIILQKLTDMALLLALEKKSSTVKIIPEIFENKAISINITFPHSPLSGIQKADLFKKYYGELGAKTHLSLGSGLEGFIAKTVADQLNLSLEVDFEIESSLLILSLKFTNIPNKT